MIAVRVYAPSRARADLLGGLGGLLVASSILLIKEPARTKLIPWLVSYAVGALLGASMLEILPKALEQLPPREVFPTLLLRHPAVLRPRKAGALAPLPHARLRGARRHRAAGGRRRRLPQLRGRRGHRRRGHDVGAARHQHRRGRDRARDPAGGRRLRHPAPRRLLARQGADAQRPLGARQHRGRAGGLPRLRPAFPRCCPTSWRSPPPASSTSRWRISFPGCTAAAPTPARCARSC